MDKKANSKFSKAVDAASWSIGGIMRAAARILGTLLLVFITTGLLFTCIFALYVKNSLSTDMKISMEDLEITLTSSIYYLDKSTGQYELLTTLYDEKNTIWVDYPMIPSYMEYAAVAIEDHRFYEHKGVDWYRTVAAFGNMFFGMKDTFGGSTITQQLIKNLTGNTDATVKRKLLEIFSAIELEKNYSKEQIVTWYLNQIFLGRGCYGVGSASQTYFGKEVWELSLAECASIIAITNNPSRYDPFISRESNKSRQETILNRMYELGYITQTEYYKAINEELPFKRAENEAYEPEIRSYYVDTIIEDVLRDLQERLGVSQNVAHRLLYGGGLQIYACIDMEIQQIVDNLYEHPELLPQSWGYTSQQLQSAIVIMDPYYGDILALSGGVGEKNQNLIFDRASYAQRPPGSAFKPLAVYGPALDLGLITQNTLVDDSPNRRLTGTTWYPMNANWGYSGIITIRDAVRASINTVAAQTLDVLGLDRSYYYLAERLGFKSSLVLERDGKTDIAYSPLSLGQLTDGVTVRQMAQGYGAFANDGIFTYARTYTHITDFNGNRVIIDNAPQQNRAFQQETARNMTDMLVNAVNWGTGTEAQLPNMMVAGKTGTTSYNYDRYFVGYTPYYLAAVWTGYDTPAVMNFSGNPAAQIWRKIMVQLHDGKEYRAFPAPASRGINTGIFGPLTPSPSPTPDETPSPTVSPDEPETTPEPTEVVTPEPSPTPEEPIVTDPPVRPTLPPGV